MNELKRELMKVAGDLSESEVRVKEAVSRRMQKKKRSWRPVAVAMAAVAVLLLLMQFQLNDTSATLSQEEYAYYLHAERVMWDNEITDNDKTRAFEKLLERVGRIEYGKSLGLSVSNEEIAARLKHNERMGESPEYKAMMNKILNEANISESTYEHIVRQQSESYLMGELIAQQLQQEYGELVEPIATQMINKYAVDYMEQHYAEDIQAFRAQYQIERDFSSPTSVTGVIGLVEGNMFYLIEDATFPDVTGRTREEIIATYFKNDKGAWYPNVDRLEVSVGDIVRVVSGSWHTVEQHRVGMNHGGAEIIQSAASPMAKIHLTDHKAEQFTAYIETLEWDTNIHVRMVRLPDYVVTANGVTYSIWAKYNKSSMEIVQHQPNAYVKIPKSIAAPFYELLQ